MRAPRLCAVVVSVLASLAAAAPAAPAAWGPPEQLSPGYPVAIESNPRGDLALLVQSGGLWLAYAPAGAGFGPLERVTMHSPYFADLALAGNGDAFVLADAPNGDQEIHVRSADGGYAAPETLAGAGKFADVAAGPDGQGVVSGGGGTFWWREPGSSFLRTSQPPVGAHMRTLVGFAGRRAMALWAAGGQLKLGELRNGALTDTQTLAQADQLEATGLTATPRGDLLVQYQARRFDEHGYPARALHAPAGQPLAEVPPPAILDEDGTLAFLRDGVGPIEVRPPAGPPEVVPVPGDVTREMGVPFLTFNPEGRLEVFGTERRSATSVRLEYAQRAPDGGWCPARPWEADGSSFPVRSAGAGARGVAAWMRPGPFVMLSRFRAGEGCPAAWVEPGATPPTPPVVAPAPLAAPRGLKAVRRGSRLVVRWRAVEGALRYRVTARAGAQQRSRTVKRAGRLRTELRGLRRHAVARVAVRALAGDGRAGRPAKLRVGPRRR